MPELVQPLDPFFGEKKNFKLLWARRWKRVDEHINVKEARVALSSLKRCCRIQEVQGHRKLTLSDNLSAVCAFSKGRSSKGSLNRVCQVATALQFSCGIIWTLRHLETKRNPSDEPSRWFERKSYPGVCPTRGVNFFGSGSNSGACASSKPVKRHSVGSELRVFPKGNGKFFLEIFAGTGRLTQEIQASGISVVSGLDYVVHSHHDLRRRATQMMILQWIEKRIFGFVHLGTPCTIWSQARHGVKDSPATRCKEETGLELALFSCEVIRACNRSGTHYALENPQRSKLFQFEPLLRAFNTGRWYVVDFSMCMYGEEFRKNTRIVTSLPQLQGLARQCCHRKHSTWLKGRVKIVDNNQKPIYVNRTALAGAYPLPLCKAYASILSQNLDLHSHDIAEIEAQWQSAIRSAASRPTAKTQRAKVTQSYRGVDFGEASEELVLLRQSGGLDRYIDVIALGRPVQDAWKALQKPKRKTRQK